MPPVDPNATPDKIWWRSFDDLADTPEFRASVEREFPAYADEMLAPSRRDFLKLMSASVALAGLTACRRWPSETIVPFAHRPEGFIPGNPEFYATAWERSGSALGVLVRSYDGRPVKIEGNPLHPQSLGGTDPLTQASILGLYSPDRAQQVTEMTVAGGTARRWDDFAAAMRPVVAAHRAQGGRGLRVLAEPSSSPTLHDMKARFLAAFPQAVWHEWEPLSRDAERDGAVLAFGKPMRAQLALDRAAVIVSFEADLLVDHPAGVRYARDFAAGRSGESMSRLIAFESAWTLTGGAADSRIPVPSRKIGALAGRLAHVLFVERGVPLPAGCEGLHAALSAFAGSHGEEDAINAAARDLLSHRGASIVAAGPKQPAAVHALCHVINAALGNVGSTVVLTADADPARVSHADSIRDLATSMAGGSVETLLIFGGNPAFDAPADLEFGKRLGSVKNRIRLGLEIDETSAASTWHLPMAHWLESWSDARGWDGTIGIVQPLILPLYDGKSAIETLALVLDETPSAGYDLVRRTARAYCAGDFEASWRRALHDGVVPGTAWAPEPAAFAPSGLGAALGSLAEAASRDGLEIVFDRDFHTYDGRFADNGWMIENPDPFTKLTWDNVALVSPEDAVAMGIDTGDVVSLKSGSTEIRIPALVQPGQAKGSVGVTVGWGRRKAGRIGTGLGVDTYPLRVSSSLWAADVVVGKTGDAHPLAMTQDHYVVDSLGQQERAIRAETLIREASLEEFRKEPDFAKHAVHIPEDVHLWKPHEYPGHKWGMTIDLTACIGCNACTVACQAENNIPIVGKKEVLRGREMHWIRIDRYFGGAPSKPKLAFQPLACHHCENAPCEQVCPVAATVHDHEGLNVMVYNRCIGTRYCSNNCPYKVRRFNYFNNHKAHGAIEMMVYNPEVTLRARGVMEKCTYCVQRIEAVKIEAKNDQRPIRDGEIVTACQQACPTQAIVFGDLNDPAARVRKLQDGERSYGVLAEINTKPRTMYLAKIRNTSEEGKA